MKESLEVSQSYHSVVERIFAQIMIKTGGVPFVLQEVPLFDMPVMLVGIAQKDKEYALVASLDKEVS